MPRFPEHSDRYLPLSQLRQIKTPSVADQVFDELHANILSLTLSPRTKISEAEVAKKMGVSRQPVREAFKRLAKLGFLIIRPQSSTTVSLISEEAALRARFIRIALEMQTCRAACETIDDIGIAKLRSILDQQAVAVAKNDRHKFHALDDEFHLEICRFSGLEFVWDLISESKGHMDRIRMLSLTENSSQQLALEEHRRMFEAISTRDAEAAASSVKLHLSRIVILIEQMKTANHSWFEDIAG
jgi:DNA-binding GntR family transcriptional regulator